MIPPLLSEIRRAAARGERVGVVWDWGDTLMREIPGQEGPMAHWSRVEAMPGALAALEALAFCRVQCVATNATESDGPMVAMALNRVGLRRRLTHFLTSGELGVSKPDPVFFGEVSRRLGIPPSRLVAVGNDYLKDVVPAKTVGMTTILVSPVAAADPELGTAGYAASSATLPNADLMVPDLTSLAVSFNLQI